MEDLILDTRKVFYEQIENLSREELLGIIERQNPEYIKQIQRTEWVFSNMMSHIRDDNGESIVSRPVTDEELKMLIDPVFIYSKDLAKVGGFNEDQQKTIHISSDPILWGREYLDLKPRIYQTLILRTPSRKKVLRLGRRMGKSFSMALYALWRAFTNPDEKIIVIAPMKSHVGLLYDEIMKMAKRNDVIANEITSSVKSPQYEIKWSNGSVIRFFTTGMKSGGKANVTRGQEADVIILDEMDYMGPDDLNAIYVMLQDTSDEKLTEKQLIGASTPSGLREWFWKWCTDPSYNFKAYWFPSYVNPMWNYEMEQDFRRQYPRDNDYRREVEADWGEAADGVYKKGYVDRAFGGLEWNWDLLESDVYESDSNFVLGVDWDKYGAGVNLVILEICGQMRTLVNPELEGKVRVAFREEIDKGEFTYTAAVERIIYLNNLFKFEAIYADRGAGEMQIEYLKEYGVNNPGTNLHKKIKGVQFAETIEVRDPYNGQAQKKRIKPFMVDNLYRMLEEDLIMFSGDDEELYFQLISYVVLRKTVYGDPVFGMGGEAQDHAHDALILACLAYAENYDQLLKARYATKVLTFSNKIILEGKQSTSQNSQIATKNGVVITEPSDIDPDAPKKQTTKTMRRSMSKPRSRGGKSVRRSMF